MKKAICLITVLITILLLCFPCCAFAGDNAITQIETGLYWNDRIVRWQFPYSDQFFLTPDDVYNHSLAQLSIGLCVASVRNLHEKLGKQESFIHDFLKDAGFSDIDTVSYDSSPQTDSIAFGIASRKIEDSTLIAVGICSANYGKEWAGNLRIGSGREHAGFRIAADKLEAYLAEYEKAHGISGKKTIWLTGFSRAAAVGNLTACDLTDQGGYERVYGYFFATPKNTKDPEPHRNIFNVIGKDDFVPAIPFSEWGFSRHGVDLFLTSPAYDSDCGKNADALNAVSNALLGNDYYNNQSAIFIFRTICSYLNEIIPSAQDYQTQLQDLLIDAISNGFSDKFLEDFLNILDRMRLSDPKKERTLEALKNYLQTAANIFVYQSAEDFVPGWNPDASLIDNLMREHHPFQYLTWLFSSDDPQMLYSQNHNCNRLVLKTDSVLEIYDEYGLLERFDEAPEFFSSEERPPEKTPYIDIFSNGQQMVVLLPSDAVFRIVLTPRQPETVWMFNMKFSCLKTAYECSDLYRIRLEKEPCTLLSDPASPAGIYYLSGAEKKMPQSVLPGSFITPAVWTELENYGLELVSIFDLVWILIAVLLLSFIGLIFSIVAAIRRKKRSLQRKPLVTMILCGFYVLVFAFCFYISWVYFPAFYFLGMAFSILLGGFAIALVFKGYGITQTKKAQRSAILLSIPMLALMVLSQIIYVPADPFSKVIFVLGIAVWLALACSLCFTIKSKRQNQARGQG